LILSIVEKWDKYIAQLLAVCLNSTTFDWKKPFLENYRLGDFNFGARKLNSGTTPMIPSITAPAGEISAGDTDPIKKSF
jgi:hypothetical protein